MTSAPTETERRIAAALVFRSETDDWPVPVFRDFVRYIANVVEDEIERRFKEAIDLTTVGIDEDFREGFIDT